MKKKPNMKSFFKVSVKKSEDGQPTITEVDYKGADGKDYKALMFEGYASTNHPDRGNDIVEPKAFTKALDTFMQNSIILLQHNKDKPVGNITEAYTDDVGLYVKGLVKVDKDNIFQDLRTGVIKTMSFGYRVNDYDIEEKEINGSKKRMVVIKELELFEVSLVSVPMNPEARLKSKADVPMGLTDLEYKSYFAPEKEDDFPFYKSVDLLVNNIEHIAKKEEGEEEVETDENKDKDDKNEGEEAADKEEDKEEKTEENNKDEDEDEDDEDEEENKEGDNKEDEKVEASTEESKVEEVAASEEAAAADEPKDEEAENTDDGKGLEIPNKKDLSLTELTVGNMYRYKATVGSEDWSWTYVNNAELIKIKTDDEGASETDPMLYMLIYYLDINGYRPGAYVDRMLYSKLEIIDVSEEQLKELQLLEPENGKSIQYSHEKLTQSLAGTAELEKQLKEANDDVANKTKALEETNSDLSKAVGLLETANGMLEEKSKTIGELTASIKSKDEIIQRAREVTIKHGNKFVKKADTDPTSLEGQLTQLKAGM